MRHETRKVLASQMFVPQNVAPRPPHHRTQGHDVLLGVHGVVHGQEQQRLFASGPIVHGLVGLVDGFEDYQLGLLLVFIVGARLLGDWALAVLPGTTGRAPTRTPPWSRRREVARRARAPMVPESPSPI